MNRLILILVFIAIVLTARSVLSKPHRDVHTNQKRTYTAGCP